MDCPPQAVCSASAVPSLGHYWKAVELFRDGVWLEEVDHWGRAFESYTHLWLYKKIILCVYVFACMNICTPCICLVPKNVRRGLWTPWTRVNYVYVGAGNRTCVFLQEQPMVLTTELSLQSSRYFPDSWSFTTQRTKAHIPAFRD